MWQWHLTRVFEPKLKIAVLGNIKAKLKAQFSGG